MAPSAATSSCKEPPKLLIDLAAEGDSNSPPPSQSTLPAGNPILFTKTGTDGGVMSLPQVTGNINMPCKYEVAPSLSSLSFPSTMNRLSHFVTTVRFLSKSPVSFSPQISIAVALERSPCRTADTGDSFCVALWPPRRPCANQTLEHCRLPNGLSY